MNVQSEAPAHGVSAVGPAVKRSTAFNGGANEAGRTDRSSSPGIERTRTYLPPLTVGLLTVLLAMIGSWNVSIWTDEAATISGAQRSVGELWQMVQRIDAVHGLYYLFMHFWIDAFGIGPFALRLPSALAAGIAAVGVYVLAARLIDRRVALISGLVFAVLPRVTWMGIEARSFGISAAVAVWLTVLLIAALRRGRWAWAGYAAVTAIGVTVNIYIALLLVAHALTLLVLRTNWRTVSIWLGAAVVGLLLASPVTLLAIGQRDQLGDTTLTPAYFLRNVIINQWFLGETPTGVSAGTGSTAVLGTDSGSLWEFSSVALAAVCWALIVYAVVVSRRASAAAPTIAPRSANNETSRRISFLAVLLPWMFVPTIIVGLYSFAVHPIYNPRYFTFTIAPVAIMIGFALVELRRRWVAILAAALIVLTAAPVYVSQRQTYAKSSTDWVNAAAYVNAHKKSGDAVYFTPLQPPTGSRVADTTRFIETAYPQDFRGLRDLTLVTTPVQNATLGGSSRLLSAARPELQSAARVWVLRRVSYPTAAAAKDDAVLKSVGLAPVAHWSGPLDIVTEYARP